MTPSSTLPKKVKAKIIRTVVEVAIVTLDLDGHIEEIDDICDEVSTEDERVVHIIEVQTFHDPGSYTPAHLLP